MMAVFTLGADEIRTRQMQAIAEAWGFAGKYDGQERLLQDAKKKKFDTVLVMDPYALDDSLTAELKSMNIEIISFGDKKRLEKKIL